MGRSLKAPGDMAALSLRRGGVSAAVAICVAAAATALAEPAAAEASMPCATPALVSQAAAQPPGDLPDAHALLDQIERATRSRSSDFVGDFVADGKAFIGFTRDLQAARAEIDAVVPRHDLVVVYRGAYTLTSLDRTMRIIGDDMADGRLPTGIRVTSVGEDVLHDRVAITLAEMRPAWIRAMRAHYGGCLLTFAQGIATND